MEMTGEQRIPATRDAVWAALNDPEILKACIPGCESIERQADNEYRVSMLAAVGPVKARFQGRLAIRDADPPHGYALSFEGSGGAAGFGKGSATVALAPAGDAGAPATQLAYTASAEVSGKLAQVGSRLIDGVAKRMAAEFFARFKGSFAPAGAGAANAAGVGDASFGAASTRQAAPSTAMEQGGAAITAPGRDIYKELRVWQATAVAAIAAACLAIGYIIGTH
ncbi:Carbon monoxide dehydrogenase [Bordetella sputigena]|uniref:CoxG family protein n=1 Tax=Bordetella sputigena TaxID=1416810 RepID=UPI0039F10DEB